jgi:hypothetical protein
MAPPLSKYKFEPMDLANMRRNHPLAGIAGRSDDEGHA